jgi:hypothetical protein
MCVRVRVGVLFTGGRLTFCAAVSYDGFAKLMRLQFVMARQYR